MYFPRCEMNRIFNNKTNLVAIIVVSNVSSVFSDGFIFLHNSIFFLSSETQKFPDFQTNTNHHVSTFFQYVSTWWNHENGLVVNYMELPHDCPKILDAIQMIAIYCNNKKDINCVTNLVWWSHCWLSLFSNSQFNGAMVKFRVFFLVGSRSFPTKLLLTSTMFVECP